MIDNSRLAAAALLIPATACATAGPEPEPPVRGDTSGHVCSDEGLGPFVGRVATAELGAEMLRLSGARILRWVPHGGAITMDLRADRLTVRLDPQNRIESATCG